jgi:acetoin utilization deacetylase AcuC-like enzyme
LPAGTSAAEYSQRFSDALAQGLEICRPDFILISSGFDVMAGDPFGGMVLEPEDLHSLTREVMAGALEGGYDPARTGLGAAAVLRALAGVDLEGG